MKIPRRASRGCDITNDDPLPRIGTPGYNDVCNLASRGDFHARYRIGRRSPARERRVIPHLTGQDGPLPRSGKEYPL